MLIAEFTVMEALQETQESLLYRATGQDGRPVLLKQARATSQRNRERLERDYLMSRSLGGAVIQPLALDADRRLLVLEDSGAEPLDRILDAPRRLSQTLDIGRRAALQLDAIHRKGIVHGDVKPQNIFINRAKDQVRLSGLGFATPELERRRILVGDLTRSPAYMAPEQTGRLRWPVEPRSDLYSFGVVLYEMTTGSLPFQARDLLEWVHCHVARRPEPPAARVPGLPRVLSDIIMKLLAKQPDERYQTAAGLAADLEYCAEVWEAKRTLSPFPLGRSDVSRELRFPQRLYGRGEETEALLRAFAGVTADGWPHLAIVSGAAGVGKSAVIESIIPEVVEANGFFVSGKFEEEQGRPVPYSALAGALTDLARARAAAPLEARAWRTSVLESLEGHGQILCEVAPELEAFIGPQPPLPELSPDQAQNRLHIVLSRFIRASASPQRPLVLFLDDLQWADDDSLRAVEYLAASSDLRHVLLVVAHRDSGSGLVPRLQEALRRASKSACGVTRIAVSPLSEEHLCRLLVDMLHHERDHVAPLARSLHRKSGGNPFFALQLLTSLHRKGLVTFDAASNAWRWSPTEIESVAVTDNVVDLLLERLNEIPAPQRELLGLAACIGSRVSSSALAAIANRTPESVEEDLTLFLHEGFTSLVGDQHQFAHDRVRSAAYRALPESLRPELHLRAARALHAQLPEPEVQAKIFEVVRHLDQARELLTDDADRKWAAELNFAAAKRAKLRGTFSATLGYLESAIGFLKPDSWETHYELTFRLHLERARYELFEGHHEQAKRWIGVLLERARGLADRGAALGVLVELLLVLSQTGAAVAAVTDHLRRFGIELSEHPTSEEVERADAAVWAQLGDREIERLAELPELTDPEIAAALELLAALLPGAYLTDRLLHYQVSCHIVSLSLRHGVIGASAVGFCAFGSAIGGAFGRYRDALRFGQVASALVERHGWVAHRVMVLTLLPKLVMPWAVPLDACLKTLEEGLEEALRDGNLPYVCYSGLHALNLRLSRGEPLAEVERRAQALQQLIRRANVVDAHEVLGFQLGFIRSLRGGSSGPVTLSGPTFDEELFRESLPEKTTSTRCWYRIYRLQLLLLHGAIKDALGEASAAAEDLWSIESQILNAEYHAFRAVALARSEGPAAERLDSMRPHLKQLRRWAASCAANFLHKESLVSAEIALLEGRDGEAMRLYEQAIRSAHDNGFVQWEGLAYERAARFYRERGFDAFAEQYLRSARRAFHQWGGRRMVQQLEQRHPQLAAGPMAPEEAIAEAFDVLAVTKASQALSGELERPRLARRVLTVLLEHAGASRGVFLSPAGGRWEVAAAVAAASDAPMQEFPLSLVQEAVERRERVAIDDATLPTRFSRDPYFAEHHPRAILALPIVGRGSLLGVVYLENEFLPGVFTPGELAALDVLAAQAAISLDNANLYSNLAEENAARRRTEENLRANRAQLQDILDNMVDAVLVCDRAGNLTMASRGAVRLFGARREDLLGPLEETLESLALSHPDGRRVSFEELPLVRAAKGERIEALDMTYFDARAGRELHLRVSGSPLHGEDGEVIGGVAAAVNVTEAVELDRLKDEFVRVMAHELKTPIAIIKGYAELLREEGAGGHRSEVAALVRGADRLDRILVDLLLLWELQLARPEPMVGERVELGALLERVVDSPDRAEARRRVVLRPCADSAWVRGNSTLLGRAVSELVDNALRYSPDTEPVDVELAVTEAEATVTVRDRGIGIPRDRQHRLFERFYRAHTDTPHDFGGVGIGLYLTRTIVSMHGGAIEFESEVGGGSTFSLRLPLASDAPAESVR